MLEIILLIYLCTKNAKLAEQKNVSKRRWVLTTVLYWMLGGGFATAVLIIVLGIDIEKDTFLNVMIENSIYFTCSGLLGGYLGYLFTRKRMENLPDSNNAIE